MKIMPTAVNPASAYPMSVTSMAFLLPSGTRKSAAPDPALRQPGRSHICHSGRDGPSGPTATAQRRAAAQPRQREPGPGPPSHDRRGRRPGRLPIAAGPALAAARTASCRNRGTRRSRAAITSRTASTRTRPPGPARPPSRTASAPISCGQISSGHSMHWSSSVSLSTGHTPGSPASIRHHRGSGPGTFALPARAGSLFSQPDQCNAGFGANATEMPFLRASNRPYRSDCSSTDRRFARSGLQIVRPHLGWRRLLTARVLARARQPAGSMPGRRLCLLRRRSARRQPGRW